MTTHFDINLHGGFWHVEGALNENARLGELFGAEPPVRLNLARVKTTNSLGIKIFVRFMEGMGKTELEFHECSYVMLELFNSFPAALGQPTQPKRVKSFYLPFACAAGGHQFAVLYTTAQIEKDGEAAVGPRPCQKCKKEATLEGRLDDYMTFLSHDP